MYLTDPQADLVRRAMNLSPQQKKYARWLYREKNRGESLPIKIAAAVTWPFWFAGNALALLLCMLRLTKELHCFPSLGYYVKDNAAERIEKGKKKWKPLLSGSEIQIVDELVSSFVGDLLFLQCPLFGSDSADEFKDQFLSALRR